MYTQTNALRLRLNCYAAVSFLILLVCGALTLGLPLREGGERSAQQLLTIMTMSRAQAVEAWMRHAQAVAWHTALRPGLRGLLQKKTVLEPAAADRLLAASMGTTGDTVALSLVGADGTLVAHSGMEIPEALAEEAMQAGGEVYVSPPVPVKRGEYILISTPVTNYASRDTHFMPYAAQRAEVIGRILLLRDLGYLRRILLPEGAVGVPAQCVLGMEGGLNFGAGADESQPLFAEAMRRARAGENGLMLGEDIAYAYAGVSWRDWGVVAAVPLSMLHAPANKQFWALVWGTLAVYILCLLGFYVLSRPLAGRILLHTQELEDEISQRRVTQAKLEKAHVMLQDAYARRRELAGEILSMLEQMRHSLATELHDNAGQQLTTLLLALDYASTRAQNGEMSVEDLCAVLERASLSVRAVQKDIRRMSHGLYPPALDLAGLSHSIQQLYHDFEGAGLVVHFSGAELPPTSEETALALYRIAQEALTNIVRHAQAHEVHMSLQLRDAAVVLTIEDDGHGFDPAAAQGAGHLGVRLMRERAQHCSGTVTFESAPGQGTLVLVEIPLQGATNA